MATEKPTVERPGKQNDQIIPYYILRVLIGIVGISLPVLVVLGKFIFDHSWDLEPSISDYYDEGTGGDIFVGTLFSLAFFLFSYRGYEPTDNWVARSGCICALGVALCPNSSKNDVISTLHFIFAFLLFTSFIIFSIYLFRKKSPHPTRQKENRNRVYFVCGIIMIICIAGIAAASFIIDKKISRDFHLIYWFETFALLSFGFSWITKAEVLFLKDEGSEEKKKLNK